MIGGSEEDFEEAFPVLAAIGDPDKIYRCGDIGAGSVTKLVNNLIGMTTNVVIAEAFSMGVKAGVDAGTLFNVVTASSGNSATLAQWEDSVLQRDFTPGFMLSLGHKDARLALELAEQLGIPMPVTTVGKERLAAALEEGWGDEAVAVVARLQEREAEIVIDGGSPGANRQLPQIPHSWDLARSSVHRCRSVYFLELTRNYKEQVDWQD